MVTNEVQTSVLLLIGFNSSIDLSEKKREEEKRLSCLTANYYFKS